MSNSVAKRPFAVSCLWAAILLCLQGCLQKLPVEEFIRAYEKRGVQAEVDGDYRLNFLYQNTEYLIAKNLQAGGKPQDSERLRHQYGNGIYVSLTVLPKEATGTPDDIRKDLVNAKLAQGEQAFGAQIAYLQEHIREFVHLEDKHGGEIPLVTYNFSRNFGIGLANSFLFAFPTDYKGHHIDPDDITIVIQDFGLQTGTIRKRLKNPGSVKLRMHND